MQIPIFVPANFRIIAHRGASAYAPENTLAAFQLAYDMGATEVETDVQLTTDGSAALCHDQTLTRYGHGDRSVEQMAWGELADLDMGSWFDPQRFGGERMITLNDLLGKFADKFIYHIELKGHALHLPETVHRIIMHHGLADQVFITSFYYDSLAAMHQIAPQLRLGWLVQTIDDETLTKAQALHLFQLCPRANRVTKAMVAAARPIVTEVRAWGLMGDAGQDQPTAVAALIHRTLAAGCEGMTINWPDWAVKQ